MRVLLPLLVLLPGSVTAQRPGQWWWEAGVTLSERSFENEVDGQLLNEFNEDSVELSFDLHGYIVHPSVASFRIGIDALLSNVDAQRSRDTNRLGLAADLNLIPRGAYPIHLFLKRGVYDYAESADDDPFVLAGAPDTSTVWGGQVRLRKGLLAGVVAGLERNTIDFLRADVNSERGEREFLEWSRGKRFHHRLRLERRLRDYGAVDLRIEDFFVNLDERGQISSSWNWEMFGRGLRRHVTVAGGPKSTTDNFRLRNRLLHKLRGNDLLDLRYTVGKTRFEDGLEIESHGFSMFYRRRLSAGVEIAPFGSYVTQSSGGREVKSPRAGISATWQKPFRTLDAMFSARASYGRVDYEGSPDDVDESQFAWGFNCSLAHGRSSGLRKELEFDVTRDELRLTSVPTLTLPDLGLPRDGLGTEDRYRGRFTIDHRWNASHVGGWGEWTSSKSSGAGVAAPFETQSLMGQLQFGTHGIGLSGTVGETNVERLGVDEQNVSFIGASASWTPRRYLTLKMSYRNDTRELATTPDIDGERYEAGVTLRFGQLILDGFAYETSERLDGGSERTHRGVTWSVSTRFAGLLPILTGTKRRGVIR
ncbi:MAG: hypothetical protein V3S47_08675 [Acidobacteriota bacterium]